MTPTHRILAVELASFLVLQWRYPPNELSGSCIAHHSVEVFEISGRIDYSNEGVSCDPPQKTQGNSEST
jgi:hypothetical protein